MRPLVRSYTRYSMLVFNWVTVGGFLLLSGAAILLSSWVWKSALRQRRRLAWPRVAGRVVEHRLREDVQGTHLEYLVAYEVAGQPMQRIARDWIPGAYTGPGRNAGQADFDDLMRKRMAVYPEGGEIELLVHPHDPGRVYYRRGITRPLLPLAVVVTAVFIVLVAMIAPAIFVAPSLPDATSPSPLPPRR